MKVTKETIQATQQSIDHWKRMIEWAESQDPTEVAEHHRMEQEIAESWYSDDCPLCKRFLQGSDELCEECPLRVVFGNCSDLLTANAWSDVRWARTWDEWLEAADVTLLQLETVLKLLKGGDDA